MADHPRSATYTPGVFEVGDVAAARRIILTPEAGTTTEERWARETPWLAERLLERFALGEGSVVLDFGCGVGRMAKELIERRGCFVLGVDLARNMRQLAPGYVDSARFSVVSPPVLDALIAHGFSADLALAVWVIQHAARPEQEIARLVRAVAPGGGVFVANNVRRAVPTDRGWADDGLDVSGMLDAAFDPVWRGRLPPEIGGEVLPDASFLATYRRR